MPEPKNGRIGGGVLKDNLLRQGVDLKFYNSNNLQSVGNPVIHLDVKNSKIGFNLENPNFEVETPTSIRTTNLLLDTYATIDQWTIDTSRIYQGNGDINLSAASNIFATAISTNDIKIDFNTISTTTPNTNLELRPDGNGTLNIHSNWNITGDLHATGDITFQGNITLGDSDEDSIDFNADIQSHIVPDVDNVSNLGSQLKNWGTIHTHTVNPQNIVVNQLITSNDNANIDRRQGNIYYVSTLGDDTNVGDHQHGAFRTLKHALDVMDASTLGPVTIHIYPGIYEEEFPLVVPENVSISGEDLRNVIIKPTSSTSTNNAFELTHNTTIENITVKDFYAPGYAFVFQNGAIISERSPYIRNVTVITQGSLTYAPVTDIYDAGDATGGVITDTFDGGSASTEVTNPTDILDGLLVTAGTVPGGGAYIDGGVLDSATLEGSMLFHSCTFITPGVDTITMTNGVRVEWLNSFTYFANRGFYATQGVNGLGSNGTRFGAELRSIGSANIYGNYGAVANGVDTLMYLIGHNFAYIGSALDSSNDSTLVIHENEAVELNSGKIHYTATDADGTFKVGDTFYVDFETGSTSIDANNVDFSGIGSIIVRNGVDRTFIDGTKVDTGNIRISGNTITTIDGDLNLSPVTDVFNTDNNPGLVISRGTDNQRNNLAGDIRFNTDSNLFEGYSTGNLSFGGVYSADRLTSVDAHDTNNTLIFRVDGSQVGTIDSDSTNLHGLSSGDILFDNNSIVTLSNQDLNLERATPTNAVSVFDLKIQGDSIENQTNNKLILENTGAGYVKFDGTYGVVIPLGPSTSRRGNPETGEIRYNTDDNQLETWDGFSWQRAAGGGGSVSADDIDDLVTLYTVILG